MHWIIPLSLLVLFEIIADIFAKEYSLKTHWYFWAGALACYIIANIFWLNSIKNGSGLAKGAILFSVASAVLATFVGLVVYHEKVSVLQVCGIVLGLCALTLIFWE